AGEPGLAPYRHPVRASEEQAHRSEHQQQLEHLQRGIRGQRHLGGPRTGALATERRLRH
ncbi:unnamed protein product, partial [Effrenium voratum]